METKATIISLGPDMDVDVDADWAAPKGFDLVVYHYTIDGYEGDGFTVLPIVTGAA